ncbi:hypothetical protein G7Z17_g453 [Cylindrodendrum hubeiense]|uniref:Shikimate kinase n=1 Tax=Cylindrodendrum hubeiense TaxID=595255 RepID=A0A9P5LMB8_9HYPO|nr:hypothetical protein G7Z17_g453 [Cylindrodendrum hubeiense]
MTTRTIPSGSITMYAPLPQYLIMQQNTQVQANAAHRPAPDVSLSIFIIGMRGAGKTTSGRWIASLLSRTFVDLDEELELRSGLSCSNIVRQRGWDFFRAEELKLLRDVMHCQPKGQDTAGVH